MGNGFGLEARFCFSVFLDLGGGLLAFVMQVWALAGTLCV